MTYYYSSPTSLEAYLRAVIAQNDLWIPHQSIQDMIRALDNINFSSRNARNEALEMIRSIVPVHPYRITGDSNAAVGDVRFGFTQNAANTVTGKIMATLYVNLTRHGWDALFQQVRSALAYSDRNNEKTMLTNGSGNTQTESINAPDPEITRSQYNDASQAYRYAVSGMMDLLRGRQSVYNMITFENEFGLDWSLTAQPPVDE